MRALIAVVCFALAMPGRSSEPEEVTRGEILEVLLTYHTALAARDAAGVRGALGPTLFMGDMRSVAGTDAARAHVFLHGDDLDAWPAAFLEEIGDYRNDFEVVATSVRAGGAVVTTRDSGRNAFRTWEDEHVLWFLGRIDGAWRIVGFLIRDIQLPAR